MFKSEENGKNVVTSVLQSIGIKPSMMSGDSKAKQDARKRYDVEKARLMLEYEKIANQQHNLQKLLNQTEDVIAKARTDITVTNSDVNSIVSALKTWSDSLENAKERKKRKAKEEAERKKREEDRKKREKEREEAERKRKEEEERKRQEDEERKRRAEEERKRREEEEQKRKEDEERKRKEEERKRKEEEERKRKEEMRRKDPNNWPTYKYYRDSDQGYHNGLCCVVTVVEGNHGFKKEDLNCVSSDSPDDLKRCSENREEIVVASVVKIIPREGFQFAMDVPMRIFVPYISIDNDKEIKLKISVDGSKWTYPEKITPTFNLNENFQNHSMEEQLISAQTSL